jgi:hypothetical protein
VTFSGLEFGLSELVLLHVPCDGSVSPPTPLLSCPHLKGVYSSPERERQKQREKGETGTEKGTDKDREGCQGRLRQIPVSGWRGENKSESQARKSAELMCPKLIFLLVAIFFHGSIRQIAETEHLKRVSSLAWFPPIRGSSRLWIPVPCSPSCAAQGVRPTSAPSSYAPWGLGWTEDAHWPCSTLSLLDPSLF